MRDALTRETIDLVLLDLKMPGEDGLSLARNIRQNSEIPIIMLTGKGDLVDRVAGLESGADDYITKPFELREILARIRSVLRRTNPGSNTSGHISNMAGQENANEVLAFEGWRLDLLRRELRCQTGSPVPLTAGEFELLAAFAKNPNRVLNRDQLIDLVKGRDWASYDRGVDTQVMRLRKKIETDPHNPSLIKTVRGVGYVFATSVKRG
jgi:two-component system, OmpR family, response regulator